MAIISDPNLARFFVHGRHGSEDVFHGGFTRLNLKKLIEHGLFQPFSTLSKANDIFWSLFNGNFAEFIVRSPKGRPMQISGI